MDILDQVEDYKDRIETIRKTISERQVKIDYLKKEMKTRSEKLKEFNLSSVSEIKERLKELEEKSIQLSEKIEKAIGNAEEKLGN